MAQEFVPSESKLEAVARISALTGSGAETLGPGSKERKSVLVNLARGVGLRADEDLPKPELGEAIARHLGTHWDAACWSAGSTITLVGLDRLLEAAQRHLHKLADQRRSPEAFSSPNAEGKAIARVLRSTVTETWDGRSCIMQMREAEFTHWAQDKWAGWYFEFIGLPRLINQLGGGPRRIRNTTFDYCLTSIWDLKVHSGDGLRSSAVLNDCAAIEEALDSGSGLGFVVLCGDRVDDNGEFRQWQRQQRLAAGKIPRPRRDTFPADGPGRKPTSSPSFTPKRIDVFHLRDRADLTQALASGALMERSQGPQLSGAPRNTKYHLSFAKARESMLLADSGPIAGHRQHASPEVTVCRLEYLTPDGWVESQAAIPLIRPARYVERLTERDKFGRCTELQSDTINGTVHVSPNPPQDFSLLEPDPPYRIPRIRNVAPN